MAEENSLVFADGDVSVIISATRRYSLHSSILRAASPVLAELLQEDAAAQLSPKAIKKGVRTKFCLLAVPNEEDEADVEYVLSSIPLNQEGRSAVRLPIGFDLENARAVPKAFAAYKAVFGAFYARPIGFGDEEDESMESILYEAHEMIKVADYLDCARSINRLIEAPLLSQGQILFQSIANMPVQWLIFANRLHSRALFKEALIHAAGKYNHAIVRSALENFDPDSEIKLLIESKAKVLVEKFQKACLNSISYFPQYLQKERHEGRADKDTIGREAYAKDILSWMSLSVLRQWISQQVILDVGQHADDMGFALAGLIVKGGNAYLSEKDMDAFHEYFPLSARGRNVMFSRLTEMKDHLKTFFAVSHLTKQDGAVPCAIEAEILTDSQELVVNRSLLEVTSAGAGHFTCTAVESKDYLFARATSPNESRESLFVGEDDSSSVE